MNTSLRLGALLALILPVTLTAAAQTDTDSTRNNNNTTLGEATVKATRLMFITKKDTVVYNMDALSTDAGTMLGEVIDRFPGLSLRNGALFYKGRQVSRVMVNGTDFVKGDTKKALEELPAFIIKNIKAYERKSDESMATGIDDGKRIQVIDILLRREFLGTWTGNLQAGYGLENYWQARGFANSFADNYRISLFGGMTNTALFQSADNNGNWNEEGGSSGETVYKRPGISGMWHNGKPEYKQGFFKISGNAVWDYRRHDDEYGSRQEQYLEEGSYFTESRSVTRNYERIVAGGLELLWAPTDSTYLSFSPQAYYRTWRDRRNSLAGTWNADPFAPGTSPIDSIANNGGNGWPDSESAVNSIRSELGERQETTGYSHFFYFTHKLTAKGLHFSVRQSLSLTPESSSTTNSMADYKYFNATTKTGKRPALLNRLIENDESSYNQMTFLDFDQPLAKTFVARAVYGFTGARNENSQSGFRLDSLGGVYADYDRYLAMFGQLPDEAEWRESVREAVMEQYADNMNRKHWAEVKLTHTGKHLYANAQSTLRFAHEEIDYRRGAMAILPLKRNYREFFINSMLRYTTDSVGRFELTYLLDTNPASMLQKVTIPNTEDPLYVTLGNPDLKDMRTHRLGFKYDRTLSGMRYVALDLGWSVDKNATAVADIYDPATGRTVSRPECVNGQWRANGNLSFNLPLTNDKTLSLTTNIAYNYNRNIRLRGTGSASAVPTRIATGNHAASTYINLRYARGPLEGRINGFISHSFQNDGNASNRSVKNWHNSYSANISYKLPWGMRLETNLRMRHIFGSDVMEGFKRLRTIWDASASQSFFKEKLTLKLQASDLLNQRAQAWFSNSNTSRASDYATQVQRIIMLHAIWRFTTAKK